MLIGVTLDALNVAIMAVVCLTGIGVFGFIPAGNGLVIEGQLPSVR